MKLAALLVALGVTCTASFPTAAGLSVDLRPAAGNPKSPQMGDNLSFHTVIRNDGRDAVEGLIAWISLVQVDKGKEHPVDLEDWSANKAVTAPSLGSGQAIETDWPMRLIQAGHYRVVVSTASRHGKALTASPFADLTVRQKPVVESQRVLPVALGLPLVIAIAMVWRRRRR